MSLANRPPEDLLDHLLEGCQLIGPDFRYRYVNHAVAAQAHRAREALVGRTMEECFPGIEGTPMFTTLKRCMVERVPGEMENEFTYPDGSTGWFALRFEPVPEGVFILSMEVTGRKQAEADRDRYAADLRQAQKLEAIGQLAGGVAHDFNNMLSVILGYCDLIRDRLPPGDPNSAALEQVRRAAERATTLTRQLLAFGRRQVLEPRNLDLNEVVRGVLPMLRRLIGEHVMPAAVEAKDLGVVRADPGQMEQVIVNLAVNARDAMPAGGTLTIETGNVDLDAAYAATRPGVTPGPHVMLAVADTGVGMDEATRSRVFEPFFTTKEAGKGTGLGLSTVYGIVKQSGGNIWVYSEKEKGTTFKIYLPRVDGRPEPVGPERREIVRGAGTETVLAVEDDDAIRDLLVEMLASGGYRVLAARDGTRAIELFRERHREISLVLTDVVMPGLSGTDLIRELRRTVPGLKALFTSGYTDDAVARHGLAEPGTPFIQKPYTLVSLLDKVREVLDSPSA